MSLRHRASSASLYQQMTSQEKPQQQQQKSQKRSSYMKPFRRIDPGKALLSCDFNVLQET